MKLSKEKGAQNGQPKGHLDKKSSTELQQAKKKKKICASATHESASSHEPDPKNNLKEHTAGEVIKKSHKRKKPVSPKKDVAVTRVAEDVKCGDSGITTGITDIKETKVDVKEHTAGEVIKKSHKRKKPVSPKKDMSVTRVAEDVKCDDSGNTTGITDIKETNIENVCVSSKKSSKASRNKKVKGENATKVTRARSAYIFFGMEERIRVKEENNLNNKDVMKVREHFRTSISSKVTH